MGRIYTVSFTDIAVSVVQDFFQIEAKTVPVILHAIFLSQNSDTGDAAAENLTIRIRKVTDAVGNVTAEAKLDSRDVAALANLNVNDTTPLVAGAQTIHVECWNVAIPFIWMPPPELRIKISPDDAVTVNLVANPDDPLTMSGVMYFEEVG